MKYGIAIDSARCMACYACFMACKDEHCGWDTTVSKAQPHMGQFWMNIKEWERGDNERRINDLYRQIKAVKSKIDMLNIRHGNYSACFNLLDMIYANAREILQATDFASEEIAKAKVLLNIDKLKKVIVEPDKAIAILKRMDADIKEIAGRTASMDGKVFGLDSGGAAVSADALAYKEELMRKQREKENLKNAALAEENTEKAEGKNNGVL